MNVEEVRAYCILKKGITEEFPFDEHTLVFKVVGKMFALLPLERLPPQINLKCNPELALELREKYDGAITPGFHMNKKHWNTILIERISPSLLKELIDHSYNLVVSKLTKKQQTELAKLKE
ncbi:MmcQ/YjbR family DNA-binding protein [Cellulophaga omnivescoria]|uniref:MmcQ/YjbR family DNA-binding protein n=1 Tax=Cellulophaga omnivescoria TaxID=1888890 RepID=UPI000985A640|nr:MmcQ/YjbR family DNA-binding protein [Cellulophaga omnivescoria]WBU88010.1 MmcQ/YjbR family DNA-binding protein [Cellulophaga omnivescoria]WKB79989.1 MmcQ/YjbR family DNA-binding protein [Cellulophaga lytica]